MRSRTVCRGTPWQLSEQLPDGELSEYCYPRSGVCVGTFGQQPAGGRPTRRADHEGAFGYDDMPFHPMDLGEEALREFFGTIGEGDPRPDDLDAEQIFLHGFELISPPWRGGWFFRLLRRN